MTVGRPARRHPLPRHRPTASSPSATPRSGPPGAPRGATNGYRVELGGVASPTSATISSPSDGRRRSSPIACSSCATASTCSSTTRSTRPTSSREGALGPLHGRVRGRRRPRGRGPPAGAVPPRPRPPRRRRRRAARRRPDLGDGAGSTRSSPRPRASRSPALGVPTAVRRGSTRGGSAVESRRSNRPIRSQREPSHAPFDEARFRQVLGHFPTGVTVITAVDAGAPVGMAVGSFTSLSLEPPLVLFCAGNTSSSWPKIRDAGVFCVNILGRRPGGRVPGLRQQGAPTSSPGSAATPRRSRASRCIDGVAGVDRLHDRRRPSTPATTTSWSAGSNDLDVSHEARPARVLPGRLRPLRGLSPCPSTPSVTSLPDIDPTAYVHPDAVVIGKVTHRCPSRPSGPAPCCAVTTPASSSAPGPRSRTARSLHNTEVLPTVVGDDCVVGHIVHLEGCTIEDGALVGNGVDRAAPGRGRAPARSSAPTPWSPTAWRCPPARWRSACRPRSARARSEPRRRTCTMPRTTSSGASATALETAPRGLTTDRGTPSETSAGSASGRSRSTGRPTPKAHELANEIEHSATARCGSPRPSARTRWCQSALLLGATNTLAAATGIANDLRP